MDHARHAPDRFVSHLHIAAHLSNIPTDVFHTDNCRLVRDDFLLCALHDDNFDTGRPVLHHSPNRDRLVGQSVGPVHRRNHEVSAFPWFWSYWLPQLPAHDERCGLQRQADVQHVAPSQEASRGF